VVRRAAILLLLLSLGDPAAGAVDKTLLRWAMTSPRIDSIAIDGNRSFNRDEIVGRLYSRTHSFWGALRSDRRTSVQRETLGRDTLEVKYLYLSNGFLGVRVMHSYEPLPPDSNALVRIRIDEGRQFRYGEKKVAGEFSAEHRERIERAVSYLRAGRPINPFAVKETETAIKTYFANRGYPYARIESSIDTSGRAESCPISFSVKSDSLVHFGDVAVEGAAYYPEYVGRRELKVKPGAVYRRQDILESQQRLFESGYFTTFQLSPVPNTADRLHPDFLLRVRERSPWYVTFRTGAGQNELRDLVWDISGGLGKRNFIGSRKLETTADYSIETSRPQRLLVHRYRLKFTEPWFLGTRTKLYLTGEYQPRLRDAVRTFDKEALSLSGTLSRWYGRQVRIDFGLEYQNVNITGVPEDEIPLVKEQEGISVRRKLFLTFRRDTRDNLFVPRSGAVTELSGEYFGGFLQGDENFFKVLASWSRYQVVWPGWVWATRIRGAWAEAFAETKSVPLDEALYLGGANTVRGFEENRLGPLSADGTPEGARYTLVMNHEFRWKTVQFLNVLPLIGDLFEKFPLWQSVFVDAGNGFRGAEEIRFDRVAISYGTGFQIVSPAGPIRIDYGQVVDTEAFEPIHRWHFTILYAF